MEQSSFGILILVLTGSTCGFYQPMDGRDCKEVLKSGNLSEHFEYSVGHGIHWLTLDDIKLYFNPNANSNNSIPTINLDLLSTDPILNSAPSLNLNTNFSTLGMQVLDRVLSHMDNKHFDGTNMGPVERIVHAFHMHEVWYRTSLVYKELLLTPPTDMAFCPCLKDIEVNGIYKRLRLMALEIREPQLIYNSNPRDGKAYGAYVNFAPKRRRRSTDESEIITEENKSDETNEILEFALNNNAEKPIVDEKSWRERTDNFQKPMCEMNKDLATFLYCMLETI